MTINNHSEPIGRTVAAIKLRAKSSDRLGVVKRVGSISMGKGYSKRTGMAREGSLDRLLGWGYPALVLVNKLSERLM